MTTNLIPPSIIGSARKADPKSRLVKLEDNKLLAIDRGAHDWYRFVLSYPPHLVREYLKRFDIQADQCVLDPFCGTGTTIVECKKNGLPSVGIERNPMAYFASSVKVDWSPDPDGLVRHSEEVVAAASEKLQSSGLMEDPRLVLESNLAYPLRVLPEESAGLILTNSISPLPLHRTLTLLEALP